MVVETKKEDKRPSFKRDPTLLELKCTENFRRRFEAQHVQFGECLVFPTRDSHSFAWKVDLPNEMVNEEYEARVWGATGFKSPSNGIGLIASIYSALREKGDRLTVTQRANEMNRLGDLMREFNPKDAIEGLLISQAIVCQEKAFELIYLSTIQPHVEWTRQHSNFANKLLTRFQAAMDSLIKYRRGGQQKVTVEHVHVEAGGKAAFGNFNIEGGGGQQTENDRGTL